MQSYDFDPNLQKVLEDAYSSIPPTNWKSWLDISSREEYESLVQKQLGLLSVDELLERLKVETTDPKLLSVDINSLLAFHNSSRPLVVCHTSGTSGGQFSDLKWYHISEELVRKLWAPGMQAIFEASGLDSNSAAVIFVPSRIGNDGISIVENKTLLKLYSAEFSQRLMLSLIKPRSYLLYEYKDANNLQILSKILSMDKISIVSAPASTVLGWADPRRLRRGLEKSLKYLSEDKYPGVSELMGIVENSGIDAAAIEIRDRLSDQLRDATLVFSISSLIESEWRKIRDFMHWEKGAEMFTNLYVGSEIGPFAATIARDDSGFPEDESMYVFPLTLPIVESRGKRDLISRGGKRIGRLLVSRTDGSDLVLNIDTGDVVTIESQEGIPKIAGQILRSSFRLKTKLVFKPEAKIPKESRIMVGDYFDLEGVEIINPRRLLACLAEKCKIDGELSVVLKLGIDDKPSVMSIPLRQSRECQAVKEIRNNLTSCPGGNEVEQAIKRMRLRLETLDRNLVETETPRSELLKLVRRGELPKGVLKRWPLYLVVPYLIS
ncbi:MAG: hypothetical protein ACETWM_08560 [Candidatus Lokiarchaeia archaeon]